MKSKIALKLTLYFALSILLFSMIAGLLFVSVFRDYSIDMRKDELVVKAEKIASGFSNYITLRNLLDGGGSISGYGDYLSFVDDVAGTSVWLVDQNRHLDSGQATGKIYTYSQLPEDAETVVKKAFDGKTTISEGFSGLLGTPTLTVGTPIVTERGVAGVVLMHTAVDGLTESVNRGISTLALSMLAALIIVGALAVFLSAKFTKPLNKMKASTALLATGNYGAKTDVSQKDEIGELAASIDILSDKLEEARQQSEKLDKLRRDFVANISHELRTPVTVLRGSLEALCDGVVDDPVQVGEYHRLMLDEAVALQRLVNDLLDLSRLQNPDFSIEQNELSLADVVSDTVRSAERLAAGKNISIRFVSEGFAARIVGDYGRLRQMFLVVLDNAIKFSPVNSEVTVLLQDNVVRIGDRGPGISPEEQAHIFDRFYKTKAETNKTGSGLGLAIARQIADRHGITITITSELGVGTEFAFCFPQN